MCLFTSPVPSQSAGIGNAVVAFLKSSKDVLDIWTCKGLEKINTDFMFYVIYYNYNVLSIDILQSIQIVRAVDKLIF